MSAVSPLNAIRRKNALHLLKYFDIDRHTLASRMDISYTHLNSYLRPNDPKGTGHKTVARFEKAFELKQGEMNFDLTEKYLLPASDNKSKKSKDSHIPTQVNVESKVSHVPKQANAETKNEIINQQILVVPLFMTDFDNGEFTPSKEPCIEKAYIKVSSVVEQGVNPDNVKAILFSGLWPKPHKTTYYIDSSVNNVDTLNVWYYLVAVDGKRKIMSVDMNDFKPNMRILGRAFHVEQPLLGI